MDKSNFPNGSVEGETKLTSHKDQIDYAKLNQQLIQSREDLEQVKYELKRKTESFEANEKALNDELDYWKENHDKIRKQLQAQNIHYEEEKLRLKNVHADGISALYEELHRYEFENEKLLKQLKDIQNRSVAESNDLERIQELEVEVLNLKEKLNDQCIDMNLCEKKCSELEDRNFALIQENEEYKHSQNAKREEIRKLNELIMELQDEIAVLKRELGELQTQPRDINTKGNSLFAEVYDSRNQIKEKLLDLAAKYQRTLKEKEGLAKEIDILRKETATLRDIINCDIKNYKPGNMYEVAGDSASMSAMKSLVESLKEEIEILKQKQPNETPDFMYYETIIDRQRRELEKLRGTLGDHSITHCMRSRKVSELGVTLAFWKSRASEAESDKRYLELKVQELQNKLLDSRPQNGSPNSAKQTDKYKKLIANKTNFTKIQVKAKSLEKPKEKKSSELQGTHHKITIISKEEMQALMENKPYPAKETEVTNGCKVEENKENEDVQKKVEEIDTKQEHTKKESTENKDLNSESSNESENRNIEKEVKKPKKTIQFAEDTKKEDGQCYRPKGKNRYVFNFQVKKID